MQNQVTQNRHDAAFDRLMVAARLHVHAKARRRAWDACNKPLEDLNLREALAFHDDPLAPDWVLDFPWTGSTGDADLDARLAEAFRALLACATLEARLRFIEGEVWRPQMFPHPAAPADLYRETLMRWWLDLFEEAAVR